MSAHPHLEYPPDDEVDSYAVLASAAKSSKESHHGSDDTISDDDRFDLDEILRGHLRGRGAVRLDWSGPTPDSPAASIRSVLKALSITVAVVLLLGAKGVVREAQTSMAPGPARTIVLAFAQPALDFDNLTGLTAPWNAAISALGQPPASPCAYGGCSKHHKKNPNSHRKTGGGQTHPSKPAKPPSIRPISYRHPLRVLVTGDSMVGYVGIELLSELYSVGPMTGSSDPHDGTGLTVPLDLAWPQEARNQAVGHRPDIVVMMMGGNDFENMTLPNGAFFAAGTPRWTREYQRRAEIVMRQYIRHGVSRVYWLSMPPSSTPSYSRDYHQIDVALKRAAAQVPGVEYLNINGPITNHGRYTNYVKVGGVETLIRESDGIHVNDAGSRLIAREVLPRIEQDWRFSRSDIRNRHTHQQSQHNHHHKVAKR